MSTGHEFMRGSKESKRWMMDDSKDPRSVWKKSSLAKAVVAEARPSSDSRSDSSGFHVVAG